MYNVDVNNVFIILDAAQCSCDVVTELTRNGMCLYTGETERDLEFVAPYLLQGEACSNFCNNGWGNAWGVLVETKASFEDCWKHLRKFLLVKTEEGQELYFRFYDPRVLKIFLPTCDEKQLIEFFGPVQKFIVEGDTKEEAIEFLHQNGILKQKVISTTAVFGNMETINA